MREVIRWAWLIICIVDCLASALAWLELKKRRDRTFVYLSRIMLADALRALTSFIGLYLFGINTQSNDVYVAAALASVIYQAYSTTSWLLYCRNIINGGGVRDLFRREKSL